MAAADFNGFDAAFCDDLDRDFAGEAAAFLPVFEEGFFVAEGERTLACFAIARLAAGLGEFLRVFLDIRLPFVAFGGSTNGILRVMSEAGGFVSHAGQG